MPAQAQAGVPGMPDKKLSVREVFGIDTDMEVPAYSKPNEYVPDFDADYVFAKEVTLAVLVDVPALAFFPEPGRRSACHEQTLRPEPC